jgi:hypothetical protein
MAVKIQSGTTVAGNPTTVTFALHYSEVRVFNRGGGDLFFTIDGSLPTVGGADNYVAPVNQTVTVPLPPPEPALAAASATVVNLISSAPVGFTVEGD